MAENKCLHCREYKNCKDSFTSWIFFIIGLVATVAVRVVTVLIHLDPLYGKIAWYVGVIGFFLFFWYKYEVNRARVKSISERDLMRKLSSQEKLSGEDYDLMGAILCGISSNKEKINYFFIFALSALALLLAVYMDFIK